VKRVEDIIHPSARECIRYIGIKEGLEIHHDGDLPARTGLGSSSSFTVGLLHALSAHVGKMITKKQLALESIHVEQDIIRENVGSQDQVSVAFGGLNSITFENDGSFRVDPIIMSSDRRQAIEGSLMLFYTGVSRIASDVAAEQIKNIPDKTKELHTIRQMANEGVKILAGNSDIVEFGRLLHEGWMLKKSLSKRITTPEIDNVYEQARRAGAIGGKLLGAGGGGFFVLFVEPHNRQRVLEALKNYLYVPFKFENLGSQIAYYEPYSSATK